MLLYAGMTTVPTMNQPSVSTEFAFRIASPRAVGARAKVLAALLFSIAMVVIGGSL